MNLFFFWKRKEAIDKLLFNLLYAKWCEVEEEGVKNVECSLLEDGRKEELLKVRCKKLGYFL
jgi:hypothetical protein